MLRLLKRQNWLTLVLLGVFLAATFGPVYANSIDDLKKEQQQNQKEIREIQENIDELREQENATLDDIKSIAEVIERLNYEIEQLNSELNKLGNEIGVTEKALIEAEAKLEERSEILNSRVRTIYENGTVGYLEVLFKAQSFSDFLSRVEFLKKIAQQDSDLIKEIKEEREIINERKAELERKKARVKLLKDRVEVNKAESDKQKKLEEEKYNLLRDDRKAAEKEQAQLEADNRQIEALIRKRMEEEAKKNNPTPPPAVSGGLYNWPVPGHSRVSSNYGWRTHPIFKNQQFHSGIDIPAPSGTSVVAAENGTVIYAGWMGGYGNTLIIDHGGGKSTLYAHLSSFSVSNGANVNKGQKVAGVGSTGNSTGPHLHFEVRINGSHTSPWNYLR